MALKQATYSFRALKHSHLVVCDLCSASTDDPQSHAAWHEGVSVPLKKGGRQSVRVPKASK